MQTDRHTCIHTYIHTYIQHNMSIHNLLTLTLPHTTCSTPILHHLFSISCFPHAIFTFLLLLVGRSWHVGLSGPLILSCFIRVYIFMIPGYMCQLQNWCQNSGEMRQLDSLNHIAEIASSIIFLQTCALAGFQVTTSPPLSLPSGLAKLAACLRSVVHIALCHQFFQLLFGQDFLSNGKPHLAKEPRRGSKLWQWTVANRIAGKAFLQCSMHQVWAKTKIHKSTMINHKYSVMTITNRTPFSIFWVINEAGYIAMHPVAIRPKGLVRSGLAP